MKPHSSMVLYLLLVMLIAVTSCANPAPTEPLPALLAEGVTTERTVTPAPVTEEPSLTPTLVPPTEAPSLTPFPPTETPTAIPTPTDTPFLGFPTAPPQAHNTRLQVRLPNLSGTFRVPADTPLTLSDIGSDGKVNTCTISMSGRVVTRRQLPIGGPSNTFKLARGNYILNCGRLNVNATITSE